MHARSMDHDLLTVDDIAADLRMSTEWVRRQCHNGVIRATKFGRAYRIHVDDLEAFKWKYRGSVVPASRVRDTKSGPRRVA